MTFPGAGRAVLIGGSSGGGTGRLDNWDTYDGTNDTAWQQWVDDTSTALGSSYQVSYTENNTIGINGLNGYMAITDGSVEHLGFITMDEQDATSMSIKLNGGYAMTRPEIRKWGDSHVLMSSTADQGSIVVFKESGTVDTGKISGLFSFQPTETRHSVVSQYWEMPGLGSTEFGTAPNGYSLIMVMRDDSPGSVSLEGSSGTAYNVPVIKHHVIQDVDTLYSTPSTGLTALTETSQYGDITGETLEAAYVPLKSYTTGTDPDTDGSFYNQVQPDGTAHTLTAESMPRLMWSGDSNFSRMLNPTFNSPPNNQVDFLGAMMNWTPYHITDGSTQGGNQQGVMWNVAFTGHYWGINHPTKTKTDFYLDRPTSGSIDAEFNDISVQNPDRIQYQGGTNRSETELGRDLVQAIRLDNDVWIGMYGDNNGTKGGNLYVNAVARTQEDLDANWTYRIQPEYIVADDVSTPDTHASNSVAVSVTNGTDSTSTAFDPDSAVLFKLVDDKFAVLWRKSTTAYISIFSAAAQTSSPATITREVDTINLGTVPAGDMCGLRMGPGVAMITCGNYYRIIKTDAV